MQQDTLLSEAVFFAVQLNNDSQLDSRTLAPSDSAARFITVSLTQTGMPKEN